MRPWFVAVVCVVVMLLPAVAGASGEAAEHAPNLFAGDLGNAIWTLVIFGVLVLVLGKFAWGPILRTLQKREQFIRDSLEQARQDREEAAATLEEYTEKLQRCGEEAKALLSQGRREAEAARKQMLVEARQEANGVIDRAREEINLARDQAVKDLYDQAASLATKAAGMIVKRELRPEDHWDLIQESLGQLAEDSQSRDEGG
jgi:F-type H+-transporting ATPase subunit b